jgi:hypothetical protein
MFTALLIQGFIVLAAMAVTMFTLEVAGMPVISNYEWEVQRGLRQRDN